MRLSCSYHHYRYCYCYAGYQPWDEALRFGKRDVTASAEEAIRLAG